jgi:hypothetical protein
MTLEELKDLYFRAYEITGQDSEAYGFEQAITMVAQATFNLTYDEVGAFFYSDKEDNIL